MKLVLSLCMVSIFLFSCSTYLIPVDSFKNQFAGMKETDMKEVIAQ
jgi:hypothetical protein